MLMKLWKPDDQRLKVHNCGWRSVGLEALPVDLYCITFLMLPQRSRLRSLRPSRERDHVVGSLVG